MSESVGRVSRSLGWTLVFLPMLVVISVGFLAFKSSHGLPADWTLWNVAAWLVPLTCGLRLMNGPSVGVAWFGTVASLALLLAHLSPMIFGETVAARWSDVGFLVACPVFAFIGAVRLTRVSNRARLLTAISVT